MKRDELQNILLGRVQDRILEHSRDGVQEQLSGQGDALARDLVRHQVMELTMSHGNLLAKIELKRLIMGQVRVQSDAVLQ